MRKMTITEALVQLKLYNNKILSAINDAKFVGSAKKSSDKVGTTKRETFNSKAKASYDSVIGLMKERSAIKSAIVKSNAQTEVEIGGITMTVAEAIERKTSIIYDQELLSKMRYQLSNANASVLKENTAVDRQIDKMLESFYGKDAANKSRQDEDAVKNISEPYKKANEVELVDPLNIEDKIEELNSAVAAFLSEVDTKLSISNSVTYIEV